MRIRTIKPSFWTDATIAALTYPARLFYVGLWNLADDAGWLAWSPVEVAAQLFPYEHPTKRVRLVEGWAKELRDTGRLLVHSCGCAEIPTMAAHQWQTRASRPIVKEHHDAHHSGAVQTSLDLAPPPPPKAPRRHRRTTPATPPAPDPEPLPRSDVQDSAPLQRGAEGRTRDRNLGIGNRDRNLSPLPPSARGADGSDGQDYDLLEEQAHADAEPDVLDGYYRLTASWPKPSVAAWLERLEEAHGPAVLPALAAEWTADSDRSTLLSRTENRLKQADHHATKAAEQARKEAARRAEEEERARIAAMPPEQREANMARLRAMLEGSGIVKPMPGGTKP